MAYGYGRTLRGAAGGVADRRTSHPPGSFLDLSDDERAARDRLGPEWDRWVARGRYDPVKPWEGEWRT